jgi:putative two-component system response regulator
MNDNLEDAENLLYTLAKAVEAKDAYTEGHVERVSGISAFIAKKIGLSHTEIEVCRKGGVLHDIGKVGVPDYLLNKPGKLTVEEMDIIMMHPVIGAEICQSLRSLGDIIHIIRHHHEKLNGSGYPDRLKGDEIQVAAQIVAVVDIFDALSSDRPYRLGLPTTKVFQILDGMEATGEINNLALNCLKENYNEIRTLV